MERRDGPRTGHDPPGPLYSITNYPKIVYLLQDLCGQGLVSRWPEKIWDDPEFGPKLEAVPYRGTACRRASKNRFFNFVFDLVVGAQSGRMGLFENVNATPPAFVAELVYSHCDRSEAATFLRRYTGLPEAGA